MVEVGTSTELEVRPVLDVLAGGVTGVEAGGGIDELDCIACELEGGPTEAEAEDPPAPLDAAATQ